eukprot:COSAG02_NODE_58_length_43613_cov_235.901572_19_plen_160_part_00
MRIPDAPETCVAPPRMQKKSEHVPSSQDICLQNHTACVQGHRIDECIQRSSPTVAGTNRVVQLTVSRFQNGIDVNIPPNLIVPSLSNRLLRNRSTVCLTTRMSPAAKNALSSNFSLLAISSHSFTQSSRRSEPIKEPQDAERGGTRSKKCTSHLNIRAD